MNRPRQTGLRTPTRYLTPVADSQDPLPAPDSIERLLRRVRETRPIEACDLNRLVRESFEAGFAAGAARALSPEAACDRPTGETRDDLRVAETERAELANPIRSLTPRRFQVLELVARGLTNAEIASVLGISANTVKAHLTSIFETLDLTNRTEAAIALQEHERELAPAPARTGPHSARDTHGAHGRCG